MCESVNSESPRWWNNHVLSQVSFCRMKASERCKVTHAELTPWFNLSLNVYSLLCRSSSIVKWDRKKPSDSFCQHDWGVSEYWQWISSPTLPRPDAKCHQTRLKWCKSMCVLLCDIYIHTHMCLMTRCITSGHQVRAVSAYDEIHSQYDIQLFYIATYIYRYIICIFICFTNPPGTETFNSAVISIELHPCHTCFCLKVFRNNVTVDHR